jgi:predicted patatin/cPLA2 family phospholipase
MKCAYTAGVLTGLAHTYPRFVPDIIIAESGSAGSATYYTTGQERHGLTTWLTLADDKKFFSYWRHPMMDIDYLVDDIFMKRHPFDLEALRRSTIDITFPLLDVHSGATKYISPKPPQNTYAVVKAAKAIPVLYGKTIRIDDGEYVDGGFGSYISDHVLEAERRGATDIIVVRVDNGPGQLMRTAFKLFARFGKKRMPIFARAAHQELARIRPVTAHSATNMITLVPSQRLSLSLTSTGRLAIRTAINQGFDDLVMHPEIETLLRS